MIPSSFPVDEIVNRLLQDAFSNNNITDNTASITSNGKGNNGRGGRHAYEFVAFLLWYLFLVICCVLPTCCAYRRRRLLEARMVEQQQIDQQQYQRNVFILRNFMSVSSGLVMNAEAAKVERTRRITQALEKTTFTVQETDVVDREEHENNVESIFEERSSPMQIDEELGDAIDQENYLTLPSDETLLNAHRTVPGGCAICLCPYEAGDQVAWSATCPHAFHSECIVPWLAKKELEQPKCPCCRQDYCRVEPVLTPLSSSSSRGTNPFLISANFWRHNHSTDEGNIVPTPDMVASQLVAGSGMPPPPISTSSSMTRAANHDALDDVEQPVETTEGREEGDTEVAEPGEGAQVGVEDARQVEDPPSSVEPTIDVEGPDGASSVSTVELATFPPYTEVAEPGEGVQVGVEDVQQVEDPPSSLEPTIDVEGTDGASSVSTVELETFPPSPTDEEEPVTKEPCQ